MRIINLITIAFVLFLPHAVSADQALTVGATPVFNLVTINPGQKAERDITLNNSSDSALKVAVEGHGFSPTDDRGGSEYPDSKTGPEQWFTFDPAAFYVPAHTSRTVAVNIAVPKDAVSGGHYVSVFFVATAPGSLSNAATQVNFSARVGTFFFMTIGGNIHPDTKITRFSTNLLWQHSPVSFNISAYNEGNVHTKPHSTLKIVDFRGVEVESSVDPGSYVLPGRTRSWNMHTRSRLLPGYYHAILTTKTTPASKETTRRISFWIFPWQILLLISLALLGCILILLRRFAVLRMSHPGLGKKYFVMLNNLHNYRKNSLL